MSLALAAALRSPSTHPAHNPSTHLPTTRGLCLQENEMRAAGVSVGTQAPTGASPLARQLARAGISADQYNPAVGFA